MTQASSPTQGAANPSGRGGRLARYGAGILGPIGVAAVQFGISALLLRTLDAGAFGLFSFMMILVFFSGGISSALLCSSFAVALRRGPGDPRQLYLSANMALSLIVGLVITAVAALTRPDATALLFGAYAFLMTLRWFARAYSYAEDGAARAAGSDLTYAGVTTAGLVIAGLLGEIGVTSALVSLVLGVLAALVMFGRAYLRAQFLDIRPAALRNYAGVWRAHARWALVGVVTTEATVNAQAYLVVALAGAAAYAPIAAAALFMRPLNLVMNALTDVERPRAARHLARGETHEALRMLPPVRLVLAAVWLASAAGALGLLWWLPGLLAGGGYEPRTILTAVALWSAVFALRCVRVPDSLMMQAAGEFRPLAFASVVSSGVSVLACLVLLLTLGPIASIAGVIVGELVFAAATGRAYRAWKRSLAPLGAEAAARP